MRLTRELLHPKGIGHQGHSYRQLKLLGVPIPPEKGWLSRLIGTEITQEKYAEFVRLGQRQTKAERKQDEQERQPPLPDLFA